MTNVRGRRAYASSNFLLKIWWFASSPSTGSSKKMYSLGFASAKIIFIMLYTLLRLLSIFASHSHEHFDKVFCKFHIKFWISHFIDSKEIFKFRFFGNQLSNLISILMHRVCCLMKFTRQEWYLRLSFRYGDKSYWALYSFSGTISSKQPIILSGSIVNVASLPLFF